MAKAKFKIPLILDVDNTAIDSIKPFELYYNEKYKNHPEFKLADANKVTTWNFINEMPLLTLEEINQIFKSTEHFWSKVKVKENSKEILKRLYDSGKYKLIWCSIGSEINITKKIIFLKEEYPFITDFEMIIQNSEIKMGKTEIITKYTTDSIYPIIADDNTLNLNNKRCWDILFKDNGDTDWNKGFNGQFVAENWLDIERYCNAIYSVTEMKI